MGEWEMHTTVYLEVVMELNLLQDCVCVCVCARGERQRENYIKMDLKEIRRTRCVYLRIWFSEYRNVPSGAATRPADVSHKCAYFYKLSFRLNYLICKVPRRHRQMQTISV